MIRGALDEAGGNRAEAARRLGMSRTTLWKKLKDGQPG
jgi:transcriptional regulator of acetoin/glycerol metabolism